MIAYMEIHDFYIIVSWLPLWRFMIITNQHLMIAFMEIHEVINQFIMIAYMEIHDSYLFGQMIAYMEIHDNYQQNLQEKLQQTGVELPKYQPLSWKEKTT